LENFPLRVSQVAGIKFLFVRQSVLLLGENRWIGSPYSTRQEYSNELSDNANLQILHSSLCRTEIELLPDVTHCHFERSEKSVFSRRFLIALLLEMTGGA
jgi:hypothetical protein